MINYFTSQYAVAIYIIVGCFGLAKLVHFVLSVFIHRLVRKTKSTLDDELLEILTKPFYFIVISVGVQIALSTLDELESFKLYIQQGFFVAYVILGASVTSRVLKTLLRHWLKLRGKYQRTPQLMSKVLAVIVYLIAVLIVLDYFNVHITPLIATLGIGGLAIGLALQSTLANLFGGLHILSDRPLNVGDFVEIDKELKGYVDDIGWRSTRIRKLSNNYVVVPNAKLADSIIVNYSLPSLETSCVVECGVGYGEDLDRVEKVALKVAKRIQKTVEGAVKEYEPKLRFKEFGDSNINFKVIMRVERYIDRFRVAHEFIKALKKEFDKQKIEISWPVVKVVKG